MRRMWQWDRYMNRKKKINNLLIMSMLFLVFILTTIGYTIYFREKTIKTYEMASVSFQRENYEEAIDLYGRIGNYKDSMEKKKEAQKFVTYYKAILLFDSEAYSNAMEMFEELGEFENSEEYLIQCKYFYGIKLYNDGKYDEAYVLFNDIGDYRDSRLYVARAIIPNVNKAQSIVYEDAINLYEAGDYQEAKNYFSQLENYKDSVEYLKKCEEQIERVSLSMQISAGQNYSLGVLEDGKVVSTGYDADGQSNINDWKDIISISGKGVVTAGLTKDGKVMISTKAVSIDTSEWEDIIQISAGDRYVVGLRCDGTVIGDGHDMGDGQLEVDSWCDITQIATGWRHTVGLKNDGEVLITGYHDEKQLNQIASEGEKWTNIVAIAAGGGGKDCKGSGHTVGLRSDGRVVAVGDNEFGQCDTSGWTEIVAVACGDWHTVGLKSDGTVVAVGNDGTANYANARNATKVDEWTNIVAIAAGSGYTIGLKSDGTMVSTGYNDNEKREKVLGWNGIMIK